jgi:hypothetical protein
MRARGVLQLVEEEMKKLGFSFAADFLPFSVQPSSFAAGLLQRPSSFCFVLLPQQLSVFYFIVSSLALLPSHSPSYASLDRICLIPATLLPFFVCWSSSQIRFCLFG